MVRAARVLAVLYEAPPPRVAGADRGDIWEMVRLGVKLGRIGRAEAIELMRLLPMTVQELLKCGPWRYRLGPDKRQATLQRFQKLTPHVACKLLDQWRQQMVA